MKSRLFYLFLFTLLSSNLQGQATRELDSLRNVLQQAVVDKSFKVDALNELAFLLLSQSPEEARQYAQQAMELSKQSPADPLGLADAWVRLGILSYRAGNYEEAKTNYHHALRIRSNENKPVLVARTYINLGVVNKQQGQFFEAISNYKKALSLLKNTDQSSLKASLYNNLGNTYQYLGDLEKAVAHIDSSIWIRKSMKGQKGLSKALLNKANLYQQQDYHQQAIQLYLDCATLFEQENDQDQRTKVYLNLAELYNRLGQSEESERYIKVAIEQQRYLNNNDLGLLEMIKGDLAMHKQKIAQARSRYQAALPYFEAANNSSKIAEVYYHLGLSHQYTGDQRAAETQFNKSLQLLDSVANPFLKSNLLYNLWTTNAHLKRPDRAFQYGQQYARLQDSLKRNHSRAASLILKNQEQQKQIELLGKDQEIQQIQLQKQGLRIKGLSIITALALISLLSGLLLYRNQKKRQLAEQNEQAIKEELTFVMREQELKMSYARLRAQHTERKRIAQDLHDRIGSMLATIKLYFKAIDAKISNLQNEQQLQYSKALGLIDQTCDEVREIAHNMQSISFQESGLVEEVKALVNNLKGTQQIDAEIVTHGFNQRFDMVFEAQIYSIIQELICNVIRHAKASKLSIQLNRFEQIINIIIDDDGIGFDKEKAYKSKGMGLKNIENRVHEMGGSFYIDTRKGNGTSITIDIPSHQTAHL